MNKLLISIADIFLDINKLTRISKLLKIGPRKLFEEFVKRPQQFAKRLEKMTTQTRKLFALELNDVNRSTAETVNLSSSWIRSGDWSPIGDGSSGDLTIWTKKGKIGYTYPGVSLRVWDAMKKAKGKNGGGAGTVFWAMYLRQYKNSTFGQFLKKLQAGQKKNVNKIKKIGKLLN